LARARSIAAAMIARFFSDGGSARFARADRSRR
jgi:hypothetical protein